MPLHLVRGDGNAGVVKVALGGATDLLMDGDPLSHGPLPPLPESPRDWFLARLRYWSALPGETDCLRGEIHEWEVGGALDRLTAANEVVVWTGPALPEQLFLALVVHLRDRLRGGDQGRLLVTTLATPTLPPAPVTPVDLVDLRAAWPAVTASDPEPLLAFLAGPPSLLRRALSRLLLRYPDARTGLSRWDRALLEATVKEGLGRHLLGRTLTQFRDEDVVDMYYLFARLRALAPLVALTADAPPDHHSPAVRPFLAGTFALTPAGRAVLAGQSSAFELVPVDDWVGGVHLRCGHLWVRERDQLRRA